MKGAEAPFPGMAQRLVLGAMSTSAELPSEHVRLSGHTATSSGPWTQKPAVLGIQPNGVHPVDKNLEQSGHRVTRSNISDSHWEVSINLKQLNNHL